MTSKKKPLVDQSIQTLDSNVIPILIFFLCKNLKQLRIRAFRGIGST